MAEAKSRTVHFSSVTQSCPTLFDPMTAARQVSLSIANSQSLLKIMSLELVMPSNQNTHHKFCLDFSRLK